MDVHTPQQRSKNMAAIRSKDTKPEMIVRRGLWKHSWPSMMRWRRKRGKGFIIGLYHDVYKFTEDKKKSDTENSEETN